MKKTSLLWAVVYLVFGAYFINLSFSFITLPEFITGFYQWITLVGGILILLGGINHFRAIKNKSLSQ